MGANMKIKEGIFEKRSGEVVSTVDIGAIVRRGPNWIYNNQDDNGIETIICPVKDYDKWVSVKWQNGSQNGYRIGYKNKFDLVYA